MDFRKILEEASISHKDFAEKIGLTYDSYRALISRGTPKWIKSFEFGYALGSKKNKKKD